MHAAVPNLISYQGCFVLNIKSRIWHTHPPDPVIIKNWKRGNYSYSANNPEARWPHKGKEQHAGHKQLLPRSNNRKKDQYLSQDCILIMMQPLIVQAESWEKMEDWCLLASYWAIWRQFGQAKLLFRTSKRVGACYDFIYTFNGKDRNSLLLLQWVRQAYLLPWKNERECHHERQKLLPHGNKGTPALSCPARGLGRFVIVRTTLIFSYCLWISVSITATMESYRDTFIIIQCYGQRRKLCPKLFERMYYIKRGWYPFLIWCITRRKMTQSSTNHRPYL